MPEPTKEELRRWSAEVLMEWMGIDASMDRRGVPIFVPIETGILYWKAKNQKIICRDWAPDDPASPAWQILAVIQAMEKRGFRYEIENYYDGRIKVSFMNGRGVFAAEIGTALLPTILKAAHAAPEPKQGGRDGD